MKTYLIRSTAFVAFLLSLSTAPLFADVDDEGLVTHLTFDEGTGRWAKDSAPHGVEDDKSELRGDTTWIDDGVHGSAVKFSGKHGSYIYLKHCSADIQVCRSVRQHNHSTFAFWFKCDDNNKKETLQTIFETGGYHNNLNVFIYEGVVHVGVIGGYPNKKPHRFQPPQWMNTKDNLRDGTDWQIVDGRWHHFAFTVEAGTSPVPKGYKVYLDGQLVMTGTGTQIDAHGAQAGIGAVNDEAIYPRSRDGWYDIPGGPHAKDADTHKDQQELCRGIYPFAGCVDDFRLYHRVLTPDEIATIHKTGREALE